MTEIPGVDMDEEELLKGKDPRQYYPGLAERCRKYYRLTIDAIREAARSKGYAVGVHGSLARDIDLIACPWAEDAAPAEELAEAIRVAAEKAGPHGVCFVSQSDKPNPRSKPHGRLCWSFHLGGGPYIDLSVMPLTPCHTPADDLVQQEGSTMAFHVKDGWHFERISSTGAVVVTHHTPCVGHEPCGGGHGVARVLEIDADSWASIVASVSKHGEENGRFYVARGFHMGEAPGCACPSAPHLPTCVLGIQT